MSGKSPLITLNNGVAMPALGLGVFLSTPEETGPAVTFALTHGYRLIDTAAAYMNEREVGEGLRQSRVDRAEVFVTTKLWITDFGYDSARRAFEASRRRLGLDYVDLYLLHWPVPSDFDATIASYQAGEQLLADGKIRALGVSNFSPRHLDTLLERTEVVPAVNQTELHPFFIQQELREANARLGIVTQSWSPIGGVVNRKAQREQGSLLSPLEHPVIVQLAAHYGKTPAQVVIRWHLDHGLSVIPKSVHPKRIAENLDVFDFALTSEEIATIDALDTGERAGFDPEVFNPSMTNLRTED